MPPVEPTFDFMIEPSFKFNYDQIKHMTVEEYALVREQLLYAASKLKPTHQGDITIPNYKYIETLTCMWCAAPFPTMEELEAHEADPH